MIKLVLFTVGVGREQMTYGVNPDKVAYVSAYPKGDSMQTKIAFSEATRDYVIVQHPVDFVINELTGEPAGA